MPSQTDGAEQYRQAHINRVWSLVRIDDSGRRPRSSASPGGSRGGAPPATDSVGDAVPVRRESARAVALAPPPLHRAAWVSRFLDKVDVSGTGCWLWTASRFPGGYGQFAIARHPHLAHRIAYELFLGPIRTGHQIHHDCEVKTCVNPLHLQSLTVAEHNALHARRRRAAKASAAAQTAVMA